MNTALIQQILRVEYDGCFDGDCADIDFSMTTGPDYPWPTEYELGLATVRRYQRRERIRREQRQAAQAKRRQERDQRRQQEQRNREYANACSFIQQHQAPTLGLVNRLLDVWDAKMLGRKFKFTCYRQFTIDTCVWDLQALNERVIAMKERHSHGL